MDLPFSVELSLQGQTWLVALGQTIHILAIAAVLSSVLMVNLRVLRFAGNAQTVGETTGRYLPWIWWGLLVLALSGALLIIIEPERPLTSPLFWIKMVLMLAGIAVTLAFRNHASAHPELWERPEHRRSMVLGFAAVNVVIWCGIIFAGRWIAYASAA